MQVMSISQMMRSEFGGDRSLSGIGGVETGRDAAEFLLLGAQTVQVCTGVMLHGYPLVKTLCGGLQVRPEPCTLWQANLHWIRAGRRG